MLFNIHEIDKDFSFSKTKMNEVNVDVKSTFGFHLSSNIYEVD